MDKRKKNATLDKLLKYDVDYSRRFVNTILKYPAFKSVKAHSKFLEYSCNGIVWLVCWLAFYYLAGNKNTYGMQINMLLGLIFDIIIIAVIKAAVRRRRPVDSKDTFELGPDKFSFPSGHASRAFFILLFFTYVHPVTIFVWPPIMAWAVSVCVSRLVLQRHYILDVICGALLGTLEGLFIYCIMLSDETAMNLIKMISDDLPGDE